MVPLVQHEVNEMKDIDLARDVALGLKGRGVLMGTTMTALEWIELFELLTDIMAQTNNTAVSFDIDRKDINVKTEA